MNGLNNVKSSWIGIESCKIVSILCVYAFGVMFHHPLSPPRPLHLADETMRFGPLVGDHKT